MFGKTIDDRAKLAAIEADLVSAAAGGTASLHAEIFNKLAGLMEDPEDVEAILDAFADVEQGKNAAWYDAVEKIPPNLMKTLSLGAMATGVMAGPASAAVRFVRNKHRYSSNLANVQALHPDLFQKNPERAQAIFDLVHSHAPNVAGNPHIAGDLMRQMMAMPQIDLGTVGKLTDISSRGSRDATPMSESLFNVADKIAPYGEKPKPAPITQHTHDHTHLPQMDVPTAQALGPFLKKSSKGKTKTAGITDAFVGSGTNLSQANNATTMQQLEAGSTLMPLDAVVKELLAKEQELATREQAIAQQEQYVQQAMQAVQEMGQHYQGETGVDPSTGDVAPGADDEPSGDEAGGEEAAPEMAADEGAGEEAPPEMGAEDTAAMGEEAPPEMGAEDPAAMGAEDPAAMGAEDPAVMGAEDPAAAEADPTAVDPSMMGAEDPAAMGAEGPVAEQTEETTDEAPADGDGGAEEDAADAGEEPADGGDSPADSGDGDSAADAPVDGDGADADPAASADGDGESAEGEDGGDGEGEGDGEGADEPKAESGGSDDGAAGADEAAGGGDDGEAGEVAAGPDENTWFNPYYAEASAGQDMGGEEPPAEGDDAADEKSEGDEPKAEKSEGGEAEKSEGEGEETAEGGDEPKAEGEDETEGAAREGGEAAEGEAPFAEAKSDDAGDGLPEGGADGEGEGEGGEEGHDAETAEALESAGPNTAESVEGTPEDQAHDAINGVEEGSPEDEMADKELAATLNAGGGPAPSQAAAPAPVAAEQTGPAEAAPSVDGGHTITLPLRITVKIGEKDPLAEQRAQAIRAFERAVLDAGNFIRK